MVYECIFLEDSGRKMPAAEHQEPPLLALGQIVQGLNAFASLLFDGKMCVVLLKAEKGLTHSK